MANIVQMGVEAFWAQLQKLETNAKRVNADLNDDKARLQAAYTAAKALPATITLYPPRGVPVLLPNPQRAQALKSLGELIHNNSVLRLRYRDLVTNYNKAVASASSALKSLGITTPTLSGEIGAVPILVPVVAVAALGVAFAIYETVRLQTDAQRRATTALLTILNDPNTTPEQKAAAAQALAKTATKKPPNLFGDMVPILALVALIVLGPQLLRSFGPRRAAV